VKRSNRDWTKVSFRHSPADSERIHENPQLGGLVPELRIEPGSSGTLNSICHAFDGDISCLVESINAKCDW
jgi:hypothetical protein